jgi:E3 ubiquitin-protein ligase UHRF1
MIVMLQRIHTLPCRAALAEAGVHALRQAGIHGDHELGAFSICLSKGYEDNVDRGNLMYVRLLLGCPIY